MTEKNQHCSFCGKEKEEVRRLIASPDGSCICDECVEICKSMIDEYADENTTQEEVALKKPAEIKAELDKYIVGQALRGSAVYTLLFLSLPAPWHEEATVLRWPQVYHAGFLRSLPA